MASEMLTSFWSQMKELKTGFLMLLVCTAVYVQVDPRIWGGVCQLLARLMVGSH
jgi:hypothetical protein